MKKGAIFDMDGLMFDTEAVYQQVWHDKADAMGIRLPADYALMICGTSGPGEEAVVAKCYPGVDPAAFIDEVNGEVTRRLEQYVPVKKGTVNILAGMKAAGMKIAVASSSPMNQIIHHVKLTDTEKYFDALVTGHDVPNGKPSPDVFLYAAEKIGLAPQDCYVFEDSHNGIRAGCAAGCASVMIPDILPITEEMKEKCAGIYQDLDEAWEKIQAGDI